MEKVILIKYGELSTKKENINFFLKKLKENILLTLKDLEVTVDYDLGRMFIPTMNNDEEVVKRVTHIFGIHEIDKGYIIDSTDFETIKGKYKSYYEKKNLKHLR